MSIKTLFATTAAATVLMAGQAFAADITVTDAWSRASAGKARAGGAFMTIKNAGAEPDTLIQADADVAPRIELHTHINENGVMKMRQVEGGIPVPANGMQMLEPGSYHVMFMGLNAPLEEGTMFPLTLTFESGETVTVDVHVKATSAMGSGMNHGNMNMGGQGQGQRQGQGQGQGQSQGQGNGMMMGQ